MSNREAGAVDESTPDDVTDKVRRWWSLSKGLQGPVSLAASLAGIAVVPVWVAGLFSSGVRDVVIATYVCATGLTPRRDITNLVPFRALSVKSCLHQALAYAAKKVT